MSSLAENVAINKKKQKSFQSSVDNYKKLLSSGKIKIKDDATPQKKSKSKKERGIVYLSNIPHGFYEEEMRNYFKQFGPISHLRLARSKNTGRNKGFAFIEFKVPDVAKIVAETMNNYLMGKRLLKAKYIPPEEQHKYYFKGKNFTSKYFPKAANRKKNIARDNETKTDKQVLTSSKKLLKSVDYVKKQLLDVGIEYDFEPIDIPNELKARGSDKETSDNTSTENDSNENTDSDSEENVPTLYIHESDDSDIVFTAPPGYNTVIVPKSNKAQRDKPKKVKKSHVASDLEESVVYAKKKVAGKKLIGISKKTKTKKSKTSKDIGTKKLQLMAKNILDNSNIRVTTRAGMKKKSEKKSHKSPKQKKN